MNSDQLLNTVTPNYLRPANRPQASHYSACGGCKPKPHHPCSLVYNGYLKDPVCPTSTNPHHVCPSYESLFFNNTVLTSLTQVALSDKAYQNLWARPCNFLVRPGDSFRLVSKTDPEVYGIYTVIEKELLQHGVKLTLTLVEAAGELNPHNIVFVEYGAPLGQQIDAPTASDGTYIFESFPTSDLLNLTNLEFSGSSIYRFAGQVREIQLNFQADANAAGPAGFDLEVPISLSGYTGTVLLTGSVQNDSGTVINAAIARVQNTTLFRIRWVADAAETYFGSVSGTWKILLLS